MAARSTASQDATQTAGSRLPWIARLDADPFPRPIERDAPVHADRVAAGVAHRRQELAGPHAEVDRGHREVREHPRRPRLHRPLVVARRERPRPRVEQLHRLCTGLDLREQVGARDRRERIHQRRPRGGVVVHQRLRPDVVARRAALDQVARERERRAGEPDQRDRELLAQEADRLGDVGLVHVGLERAEPRDAGRVPDRLVDDRTDARLDPDGDPDRRDRHHDVGEHDRRVQRHPPEGLQGELDGELRLADRLEDVPVTAELPVLGQVPARLAHEPDRGAVDGLAPERAKESVVHGPKDTDGYGGRRTAPGDRTCGIRAAPCRAARTRGRPQA